MILGLKYNKNHLLSKLFVPGTAPNPKFKKIKSPCKHYTAQQFLDNEFAFCPKCGAKYEPSKENPVIHGVKMIGTDIFYESKPKIEELRDIFDYRLKVVGNDCYIILAVAEDCIDLQQLNKIKKFKNVMLANELWEDEYFGVYRC